MKNNDTLIQPGKHAMCKHTTHPMFLALISSIFSDLATRCNNASACIVYFFNTFTVEVQCVGGLCSKGCTILEKMRESQFFLVLDCDHNSRKCNVNKKKKKKLQKIDISLFEHDGNRLSEHTKKKNI